jgi:hypothetical protein
MENEFKYKLGSKVCVETSHSSNLFWTMFKLGVILNLNKFNHVSHCSHNAKSVKYMIL